MLFPAQSRGVWGPAAVLAAAGTGLPSEAAVVFETRALSGDAAPGTAPGVNFSGFNSPVLNGAGQTAFVGSLTGAGVDSANDSGIWSEGGGSGLALVAREGDAAPGTAAGVNFSFVNPPVLNGAGQSAFRGFIAGSGVDSTNDRGIWSEGGGAGLALVAREGDAAPGTAAGVNFSFVNSPVLNGAGQTAFVGSITGLGVDSTNDSGIWSEGGGSGLALVARTGRAAPGTGDGVNFSFVNPPVLNGAGQTAFFGSLTGSGVTAANDRGIWSEGGGAGLALVARTGRAAPGTGDGVSFSGFNSPVLDGAGQTAFLGSLTGSGVTTANDRGIWSEGGGAGLALVARAGDAAPGTADGVNFSGFNSPVLNGAGQTAFLGALTGLGVNSSNNSGIWSEGGGAGLALVAREGDAAPGTAGGVNFSSFNSPVLNGAGQTAFRGFLTGTGVDSTNDTGLWASDLDGDLRLIVRTGDLFDVNDDPFLETLRTVSLVSFSSNSGGEDGRPSGFNDAGQLAFRLRFTDGSEGIFVANTVAAALGLAGDYNDSGSVEQGDLDLVLNNWGGPRTAGFVANADGFTTANVDQEELDRVLNNWGSSNAPSFEGSAVPEPATLALLSLGGLAMLRRRSA